MADDPFAKYGGAAVQDAPQPSPAAALGASADPFAKYGGGSLDSPKQASSAGADAADQPQSIGQTIKGWRDSVDASINSPESTPDARDTWKGQLERFGQGAAQGLLAPVLHPVDTAKGIMRSTPPGMLYDAATGQKNVGQEIGQQALQNPAQTAGQLAGGAMFGKVVGGVGEAAGAAGDLADRWKPKTSPEVVAPSTQAGAKLARAVSPTTQIAPGDEAAITAQTPGIKEYAARTNNPLNTRWEYAKAAEGHGNEWRALYQDKILGPEQDFKAEVAPGKKMSLGEIDNRISDIDADLRNDYLRPNEAKQFNNAQARAMKAEAASLNKILAKNLSDRTGLNPEEIKQIRMAYGQSRAVSQFTDLARRQPGTSPGGLPHTKSGVVQQAAEAVQGGKSSIVERAYQDAIRSPDLQAKQASDIPGYETRINQQKASLAQKAVANQAAAQAEAVKANELGQGAQDASAARSQQAGEARQANRATDAQRYVGAETHDFDMGAWMRDHPNAPKPQIDAVRSRLQKNGFTVRE